MSLVKRLGLTKQKTVIIIMVTVIIFSAILYWLLSRTEEIKLIFTYQPSTHHIAAFIILHNHWIEEEAAKLGYKLQINEECYGSGPPQMERFAAGAVDVAYVGAAPVINEVGWSLKKGYPKAVIVAAVNLQGSALVMRTDFEYTGPKSLKKATIGTFPPGSIQDTILKDWLNKNGLSYGPPGTSGVDVFVRSADPRELITLLNASLVDGIFVPSPSPEICEYKGIGKIVESSANMIQNHPCCVLALRDSFITEHRDLAEIIVKCHIRAEQFIHKNPEEAVNIAAEKLAELWKESEEFVRTIVEKALIENPTGLVYCPDPHEIVEGVMYYVNVQWKLNYIPVKPTVDQLFDFSLYDNVYCNVGV